MSSPDNPKELIPEYIPIETPEHATPSGARMSVAETVYYEGAVEEDARSCGKPFSRLIQSDDEPYQRKIKLNQTWKMLEAGWVKKPGMLHIDNRGKVNVLVGVPVQAQPEKDRDMHSPAPAESGVVIVPVISIRPGESCRFEPVTVEAFQIKSDKVGEIETTECYLSIFPG